MPAGKLKTFIRSVSLILLSALTISSALAFSACGNNRYFVTLMDGNEILTTILTDDNGYAAVPEQRKEGYDFDGWYYDGNRKFSDTDILVSNTTLYCGWKSKSYIITFDVNGGEELSEKTYTVLSGDLITDAPVPVREHFSFVGWTYEGKVVDLEKGFDFAKDVVFTARWKANENTITYYAGGGVIIDNAGNEFIGSSVRQRVSYGSEFAVFAARLPGYTFAGWKDADGKELSSGVWTDSVDRAVTAEYRANRYIVTFDYGDGEPLVANVTFGAPYDFGTYQHGKEGYVFDGWYYVEEGKTVPVESAGNAWSIAGNVTLYADYKANVYKLSLYLKETDESPFASYSVPFSSLLELPEEPSAPAGQAFAGWWTKAGKRLMPDLQWTYNRAVDAYASFIDADSAAILTVEYWLENADGTFEKSDGYSINCYAGETVTIDTSGFGSKFDGFYFDESFKNNGETIVSVGNVGLTRQYYFHRDRYVCTYESDGGVVKTATVRWGESFALPTDTVKKGYELAGWLNGGVTLTGTYTAGKEDLNFVAVWKIKTFTVFLDGKEEFKINYNGNVAEFASRIVLPDSDEKIFAGWNMNGSLLMTGEEAAALALWNFDSDVKLPDGTYEMRLESVWTPKAAEYDIEVYLEADSGVYVLSETHSLTEKGEIGEKVFFDAYTYAIDGYVFDRGNENNLLIAEVVSTEDGERTVLRAYFRREK